MADKHQKEDLNSSYNFTPKEVSWTANVDSPGIAKTVFTHVSRFHSLLKDWMRIREKGAKVCKAISALKLHECTDDYYPQVLQPLTESLLDALESCKDVVDESCQELLKASGTPILKVLQKLFDSDLLEGTTPEAWSRCVVMLFFKKSVSTLDSQFQALSKLQPGVQPIISTWSVCKITDCIQNIHNSLLKEIKLKEVITENIAHCRDERLMEVYVSAWEFDAYLDLDPTSYLFVDVGLPSVT